MKKSGVFILIFLINYLFANPIHAQKDYELLYTEAIQLLDGGKRTEGLEMLNKVIGINPTYADALYARSYFFMSDQKYEEAIRDYDLLILLQPEEYSLYMYRAQAKMYAEMYTESEDDFFQAINLDSTQADVYNGLGSLYFTLDLYEDAKISFDKAIKLNTDNIYAYYYRAATHSNLKKYDLALADIETVLKLDEKDLEAQRLKAEIFLVTHQYDKVILLYESLQKQNVDFQLTDFLNWGISYYRKKNYQEAIFYFELPQNEQDPELFYHIARTKYQLKDKPKALEMLNKAIALIDITDEINANFFYDRAVVKYYSKDIKGAEKDFLYALYLLPEIIDKQDYFGEKIDLLDDCNKLLKIEEKQPQVKEALFGGLKDRAEALIIEGEPEKSLNEIAKAIRLDSLDSYAYTIRGTAQAMLSQYNEAIASIDQAASLVKNKNNEKNFYTKALALKELMRYEEAKIALSEAIKINSKDPEYFAERANVLYEIGNYKNALDDIQIAIKLNPSEVSYLTDRALYYYQNKDYAKSIQDCNLVLNSDKENLMAYYARGLANEAMENYKEAAEDFKFILEILPNDKEINALYENAILKSQGN